MSTSSNFVEALSIEPLKNEASISMYKHEFSLEYQPSRKISLGALLSVYSASISNELVSDPEVRTSPGDQFFFGEYRFYDEPGASVGGAFVLKFPGYSNPTFQEFQASGSSLAILMGDAQTDVTGLITGEYWPSQVVRGRIDTGYTFRTEQYSAEIPFLASIAFVTPKIEVDLKVRGNFTLRTDKFQSSSDGADELKKAFGGSDYAFSANPWIFVINPTVEMWVSPKWAVGFDYSYPLFGNRAPFYQNIALSLTYRWAKSARRNQKTFREVDIGTDQESGQFQGEIQGKDLEPKAAQPERIREEPEDEVFE
jgi:hypothetical protein